MRKEEVAQKIKEFLSSTGIQVIKVEDVVIIYLEQPIKLKEGDYNKFSNFLKSLHFLPTNTWEDKLSDFWDYRSYAGFKEFENGEGDRVIVYYTKVSTNDGTVYYVEKIEERVKEEKTSFS